MSDYTTERRNATTTEDFYEILEPSPATERDLVAEALAEVIRLCFVSPRGKMPAAASAGVLAKRMESAYRNFVALCYVLKPQSLPGDFHACEIAAALGVSRQAFSLHCVKWSDRLNGMRGPGMKTPEARKSYSRHNRRGTKHERPRSQAAGIGELRTDPLKAERTACRIAEAVEKFRAGEAWDATDRRLLRIAGFISEGDELTEAGRDLLNGAAPPPAKESLAAPD